MGHQNCHCRADELDSQFHLERGSEGTIWRHCDCALCGRRDLHCEFSIGEGLRRRRIDPSAVDHRSTVDHPVGVGVLRDRLEREIGGNQLTAKYMIELGIGVFSFEGRGEHDMRSAEHFALLWLR